MTTPLKNPHDKFFRESFSHKAVAQDFLQQYLPAEIVAKLDFRTLKIEKDSFIEKELQPHFSDMLYTVNYRQQPLQVYLLFEHKSYTDSLIAFQLLTYLVKIWGQYRKQHPEARTLPVVLPLVCKRSF